MNILCASAPLREKRIVKCMPRAETQGRREKYGAGKLCHMHAVEDHGKFFGRKATIL